ncbi:MAG: polar amino acid transport system substrate-binding protein [Oleiphilaceae bacterium]|jgi:polar amino acid transport system substrate-binding protein
MNNRTLVKSAFAFIITVSTLGSISAPATADALDEITSRGKILAAIDPTFAPFEYTDSNNKIIGYDAELIEAIAKDWGVSVEFQVMSFPGIIPGLIANSFDMSVSALNVTAERAKKISYTVPIASTVNAVLKSKSDSKVKGSAIGDLSGLKCAVKQTAQPEKMMQDFNKELSAAGKKEVQLMSFDTVEQTISALVAKRVDCVVDDKSVLVAAMTARSGSDLEVIGELGGSALIAWGVNKSNPKLTAALNKTIIKLKKDGTLEELQKKYFGYEVANLPEKDFIPK